MRIAVTATGGGVGQSILKALKGSDYEMIALDGDRLGAGLYMVPESYIIPFASDPEFVPFLLNFCKEKKIDLLFPGMDCELFKLSNSKQLFEKIGAKVVISRESVIDIADDKLKTQLWLEDHGFPFIETFDTDDREVKYVLKPQSGGARSKGVYTIGSRDIFGFKATTNYVAQKYIEGDEYTCGSVTLDGKFKGCIVMRRILRDGDTYKAFVEDNAEIEQLIAAVCAELKPEGACNFQLRLSDKPYIFEINARCSGTTACRALAGFNEPLSIADYYLKGIEPQYDIKQISILRYWNELIVKLK